MSGDRPARAGRREAVLMGLVFAGLLVLPVAAWGAVLGARFAAAALESRLRVCRCGMETSAVGDCRAYSSAQAVYKRYDWNGDGKLTYAPQVYLLAATSAPADCTRLLSTDFADAATQPQLPMHGYIFREMSTIAGEPIDWEQDFALCATPAVYGRTGYETFIVTTDGTIYSKDLGCYGFVDDYPADLQADGWIVAE